MFYEWLGKEPVDARKATAVQELLRSNEKKENFIVTCVITHLEVLPTKLDHKGANDEADYLALFDGVKFGEIELSTNIVLRAREIRDFYYVAPDADGKGAKMMDLGDAIHLAAASIHAVSEFHTRDGDKKVQKYPC
jgi:predicted nucleic acid-binding protein